MNKVQVIIGIILIVFGSVLVIGYVRGTHMVLLPNPNGSTIKASKKILGQDAVISEFIIPNQIAIKEQAQDFVDNSQEIMVKKAYDWLENGYKYTVDDIIIYAGGEKIIESTADNWNLPIISLAIYKHVGHFVGDCEDGSFLLVSILRALKVPCWAELGTITIDGKDYGHVWVVVKLNGKEYLLETTLGESLAEFIPVPDFYHPYVRWNESEAIFSTAGKIDEELPRLTPYEINQLKELL